MLSGVNSLALDAKGRLAIPTRYRDRLEDLCACQLVVTIDPEDRCLLIYPQSEWKEVEERLSRLPSLNKAVRRLQRLLVGRSRDGVEELLAVAPDFQDDRRPGTGE